MMGNAPTNHETVDDITANQRWNRQKNRLQLEIERSSVMAVDECACVRRIFDITQTSGVYIELISTHRRGSVER